MQNLPVRYDRDDKAVRVSYPVIAQVGMQAGDPPDSGDILEWWKILRRSVWVLVAAGIAGAVVGFLATLPQTPVYKSYATLEIQQLNQDYMNIRQVDPTAVDSWGDSYIQTQLQILQSNSMMDRVYKKMRKAHPADEQLLPPSRLDAWAAATGFSVAPKKPDFDAAFIDVARSMNVRGSGLNRIVEISAESANPALAAEFVNVLTEEFIERSLEARWNAAQQTSNWLTRQIDNLKVKVEKAEEALHGYTQTTGLLFTADRENLSEQRLKQLQEELTRAHAERVARQAKYEQVSKSPPEALPEIVDDPALRDHHAKIAELKRQQAELDSYLLPLHPRVQRLEAQVAALGKSLETSRKNILDKIKNEYEVAHTRESLLNKAYTEQAGIVTSQTLAAFHYNMLKREVDTTRQLYDSMLQKMKEAEVASAIRASAVQVVDPARPSSSPHKPDRRLSAIFGILCGLSLGAAAVLIRERSDRTLRGPGDISAYVGLPELGIIPSARAEYKIVGKPKSGSPLSIRGAQTHADSAGERLELAVATRRVSLIAEAYRCTLTSIMFSGDAITRSHVTVISSPGPREGKTTSVSNLGIAFAESNRKVLLIDGDLRRPSLHKVFDVSGEGGLVSVLRGKEPVSETTVASVIQATRIPGLFILPSGLRAVNATNLLYSPRMLELLAVVRKQFDTILIDTPPLLQMFDARVLARLSDSVILVFRAARTTRDAAIAARQRIVNNGTPVIGTILTDWETGGISNPYGSDYLKAHKQYYAAMRDSEQESQS